MYFIEFYKKYVISIIISNLKKEKRKKKRNSYIIYDELLESEQIYSNNVCDENSVLKDGAHY